MQYNFKRWPEFLWAVAVAVGIVLAQAMMTLDPATVTDWRAWSIGVLGAAVRAVGGAVLPWLTTKPPEE